MKNNQLQSSYEQEKAELESQHTKERANMVRILYSFILLLIFHTK